MIDVADFRTLNDSPWQVRIIRPGYAYGRNNVLTNDSGRDLVEFWDSRFSQFVSRYYADTLLKSPLTHGLDLQGDVPSWKIDGSTMQKVLGFIRENLSPAA